METIPSHKRSPAAAALFLLFLAGCASVPPRYGPSADSLAAQRVLIESRYYLPAAVLVRELKAVEHWDDQVQVWSVTAGGHELRAAPQMSVVLVDGSACPVPAPPRMEQGRLLLPEQVWTQWLYRWRAPPFSAPSPSSGVRLRTLVIDAGHGGKDPGAIGRNGLREKDVTLDVARRFRDLLINDGFRVVMTRYDDRFIPLSGRSAIANRERADLFISIHANSSRSRRASGYEAYYLSEATDDQARALEAAENVELPEEVGQAASSETEAILWDLLYTEHRRESLDLASHACRGLAGQGMLTENRGVKSARFAVLKGARMPAVLVEVGFISNPDEESRMRRSEFRQRLAQGLRQAILTFRKEIERKYAYSP